MGGLARHGVPRHEIECADFVHGHDDLPWIPLGQHLHHVRHTLTSRLRLQNVLEWRGRFLDVFRYLLGDGACDQPSDDVADYDAANASVQLAKSCHPSQSEHFQNAPGPWANHRGKTAEDFHVVVGLDHPKMCSTDMRTWCGAMTC